jgi:putative hydrolase of the HAD superfamily
MNRVIVFDLDDTLFPEWQYVLSGFHAVDAYLCDIGHCDRAAFYNAAKSLFEAGSRGNIFDLALNQLNLPSEKDFVAELVRTYREHKPALTLHEDAKWALDHFRARGHVFGLISDGYLIAQQNKFAALNIAHYFAATVFSDAFGRDAWKPSPIPYQKIMEQIPGPASDFVYIADNPKKDFITARKLGWSTIHIERPDGTYHNIQVEPEFDADRRIKTLFKLKD